MPYATDDIPLPCNSAAAIVAMNAGWVRLTFRKANGHTVTRLGTRNTSIICRYGSMRDSDLIQQADEWADNILYWDFARGDIRSFCRIDLLELAIPDSAPELNH